MISQVLIGMKFSMLITSIQRYLS
nr:unnamed protein product [Callosobruchus chinensis]CAH7746632.1 unnamed protein product [Callosobruchus chinensis]CAH7752554.1 unnamed protein product [Callosobruchus chinensis]CAH7756131.1 unnamed protein product [Callosobruchus chinensis]CAH7757972.1 unnamed protein product [Callosobruchus chinensis]